MTNWLESISLEGQDVRLVPLELEHIVSLLEAAKDGNLWELWYTSVPSEKNVHAYVERALHEYHERRSLPFVVIDKKTDSIIGTTRYCNVDEANLRLEIGYTWYARSSQKTGVNTECKYLLLKHAFESYGAIAVEFRTHWHNHPSRNAILRLGAKQDGVLRNHRIDKEGVMRDTVVFSIIQSEWKVVKRSLEHKMRKSYQ